MGRRERGEKIRKEKRKEEAKKQERNISSKQEGSSCVLETLGRL